MGLFLTTAGRANYELRIWGGSNSMSKDLAKSVGKNELVASCSTAFAEVSKRILSSLQKEKKNFTWISGNRFLLKRHPRPP
jgi:hypothetical protein